MGHPDSVAHDEAVAARAVDAEIMMKEDKMRGAVMHGPGDVRVEERDTPQIIESTDAIIRVSAACVCGSDLWPYRGVEEMQWPAPMGHEYAGVVEEVGEQVTTIKPGHVRRQHGDVRRAR